MKIKIFICLLFASLSAEPQQAIAQGKCILEGTADINAGTVEIWRHEYECVRNSTDMIAHGGITNGRFRIEADAPGAIVCRVYRSDKVGWYPVFLEPDVTTVSNMGDKSRGNIVFEGGENQRIFNEFLGMHHDAYEKYRKVLAEYNNNLDKNFDKIRPRANVILNELCRSLDDFFVRYRDSAAAAYVLYMLSYGADIGNPPLDDLKAKYNTLADGPRNNPYGRKVAATIRKMDTNQLSRYTPPDFL